MTGLRKKPFTKRDGSLLLKVEGPASALKVRLRIVVSKKVARGAVQRNRIRRVLREAVRKELEENKGTEDFVLIVLPGIDLQAAKESVHRLFQTVRRI